MRSKARTDKKFGRRWSTLDEIRRRSSSERTDGLIAAAALRDRRRGDITRMLGMDCGRVAILNRCSARCISNVAKPPRDRRLRKNGKKGSEKNASKKRKGAAEGRADEPLLPLMIAEDTTERFHSSARSALEAHQTASTGRTLGTTAMLRIWARGEGAWRRTVEDWSALRRLRSGSPDFSLEDDRVGPHSGNYAVRNALGSNIVRN